MGFINDIRKLLVLLPKKRQSLFFSATMPQTIVELSQKILGDYDKVTIKPEQATAEKVKQAIYFVPKGSKIKLLIHLLNIQIFDAALVFSRTKHGANKIVKLLDREGIKAEAIHGNKSQTARQKALNNFKEGTTKVLIATDIAARGIDVDSLSYVVNYDLPNVPETYVHRIGRTGRAGASGLAISFCDREERPYLRDIQKLINQKIPVITEHPFVDDSPETHNSNRPKQRNKPHHKKSSSRSGNNNWRNKNKGKRKPNSRNRDQ